MLTVSILHPQGNEILSEVISRWSDPPQDLKDLFNLQVDRLVEG